MKKEAERLGTAQDILHVWLHCVDNVCVSLGAMATSRRASDIGDTTIMIGTSEQMNEKLWITSFLAEDVHASPAE